MRQRFVSPQSRKAWLFHRGKWFSIDDPLLGEEPLMVRTSNPRRRTQQRLFHGYNPTPWTLGPTFLKPTYSGTLVYVYIHQQRRKAKYLLLIETQRASEIVFAQDLPDTIDLLHWLAPIVENSILVDLYRRGINAFSHNEQTI